MADFRIRIASFFGTFVILLRALPEHDTSCVATRFTVTCGVSEVPVYTGSVSRPRGRVEHPSHGHLLRELRWSPAAGRGCAPYGRAPYGMAPIRRPQRTMASSSGERMDGRRPTGRPARARVWASERGTDH